jgi:hypothetical protein
MPPKSTETAVGCRALEVPVDPHPGQRGAFIPEMLKFLMEKGGESNPKIHILKLEIVGICWKSVKHSTCCHEESL